MSPDLYFSTERFEKEIRIFGLRSWFFLGHKSEFKDSNTFYRRSVWNFEVLVANTEKGIQCWLNACPHRGATLCSKNSAKAPLECPYHGMRYNLDGHGEATWNNQKVELDLQALAVENLGDFLFCSHQPASTLKDQVGDFFQEISSWSQAIGSLAASETLQVKQNWKILMENLNESLHTVWVHPTNLGRQGELRISPDYKYEFSSLSSMLKSKTTSLSQRMQSILEKRTEDRPEKVEQYYHFSLFPNFNISTEMGTFYSEISVRPVTVSESLVDFKVYVPQTPKSSGLSHNHIDYLMGGVRTILQEDIAIAEKMGNSMTYLKKELFYTALEKRAEFFIKNVETYFNKWK